MPETWRTIAGYGGFYDVSDEGRVRSWHKGKWGRASEPKILRASPASNGYCRVTLQGVTRNEYRQVHELALTTFRGPAPVGMLGAHCNGNPLDNRLWNLRWATPKGNGDDTEWHGRRAWGERHGMAKLDDDAVRFIRTSSLPVKDLAVRFSVCRGSVSRVLAGRGWTHVAA